METVVLFSTENIAGNAMFEDQQSDFDLPGVSHTKPDDKDDNGDEDTDNDSNDDNPPIDPDVNQAPVVLQPTPKPKDK